MWLTVLHHASQRDLKIKHITQDHYNQSAVEILQALEKLGEKVRCFSIAVHPVPLFESTLSIRRLPNLSSFDAVFQLSAEESQFLEKMSNSRQMEAAVEKQIGTGTQQRIVASVSSQIKSAQ